ncbi:MAG: hypothetical protein MOGMAGMI_01771 [Candidatus Omnitrophica bacterium]|nr:hypothetical protein [Candidatus Omnitrophota bacterium]
MKRSIGVTIAVVIGVAALTAGATMPGRTKNYVNDYAGVLTLQERAAMEVVLRRSHNIHPKTEIIVTTFKDTMGRPLEEFEHDYIVRWRMWWPFDNPRRAHLILLLDPPQVRLLLSAPLLRIIPPGRMDQILIHRMGPYIDEGRYADGLMTGLYDVLQDLGRL